MELAHLLAPARPQACVFSEGRGEVRVSMNEEAGGVIG